MCLREGPVPVSHRQTSALLSGPAAAQIGGGTEVTVRRGPGRPRRDGQPPVQRGALAGQTPVAPRQLAVEAPEVVGSESLAQALARFQAEQRQSVRLMIAGQVYTSLGLDMSVLPTTPDSQGQLESALGSRLSYNEGRTLIPTFVQFLAGLEADESEKK